MTAMRPQPRPGVLDIEAYVPGKSSAPGVAKVFKLSSNETPLGPSPRAIEAYQSVAAKEANKTASVDELLAKANARTKIVYLANPNNPTGTYISFDEVKRLHRSLPPSVLLVLDAAYAEYVRRNDYESGIELVATSANVVMTRTFSKIHGLAALRLGWMFGPAHVVDAINRIRGPFNVSTPAIAAGTKYSRAAPRFSTGSARPEPSAAAR